MGGLRLLTAGESHGPAEVCVVAGVPAGVELSAGDIDADLARRQRGYGRGGRMRIEHDRVRILSGVRYGRTHWQSHSVGGRQRRSRELACRDAAGAAGGRACGPRHRGSTGARGPCRGGQDRYRRHQGHPREVQCTGDRRAGGRRVRRQGDPGSSGRDGARACDRCGWRDRVDGGRSHPPRQRGLGGRGIVRVRVRRRRR